MPTNVDILILGGGPAGLSTALHLTRIAPHLTARILILEKEHYPRPKLCAGGLTPDAEALLEGLNLDVREIPHADASAIHFDFAGQGLTVRSPRQHTLRVIRRDEFDAWLAGKTRGAGIEIREGVTVKDVRLDDSGVTAITNQGEFRATVVVGADGSNGVARRCVLPEAPIYTARALEVITPVIARRAATKQSPDIEETAALTSFARNDTAIFEFSPVPENISGYIWDFPTQTKGQPSRCWGIYDANLLANQKRRPLRKLLREEMAKHGFALDDYELKGHPIRWYDPRNPVSVPRVLLVGDAAGAGPLFGEGISIALGYGKLAAGELVHALETGDLSFNGYRRRLRRSSLGQTLLVRWVIAHILYRLRWRWFQNLFWRFCKPVILPAAWLLVLNWGRRLR